MEDRPTRRLALFRYAALPLGALVVEILFSGTSIPPCHSADPALLGLGLLPQANYAVRWSCSLNDRLACCMNAQMLDSSFCDVQVYLSQQLMLMGVTLPLLAVSRHTKPWAATSDTAACLICTAGEIL